MKGSIKTEAREAAERNVPFDVVQRAARISAYIDGYMAGHAAHTRKLNKVLLARCSAETQEVSDG